MSSRGRRWAVLIGAALYALLVMANPLLHHDLDCHLKSPLHCTACTANPFASRIECGASPGLFFLPVAGRIEATGEEPRCAAVSGHLPSRSPPA